MVLLVSLLYLSAAAIYLFVYRKRWMLNPGPLFVASQVVLFVGTVPLLQTTVEADQVHLWVLFVGLLAFMYGSVLGTQLHPVSPHRAESWYRAPIDRVEKSNTFWTLVFLILGVSIAVVVLYYRAVGYNLFLSSVMSVFSPSAGSTDVATLRLQAYAGDEYFAPGYVNQFKNVLLPMLTAYIAVRAVLERRSGMAACAAVLCIFTAIGLLGTGQRGPFVMASIVAFMFVRSSLSGTGARKASVLLIVTAVVVLAIATAVLGRRTSTLDGAGDVVTVLREIWDRVFLSNQLSGVVGFQYVFARPVQYGAEWLTGLQGLLPGFRGSRLSNEIFAVLYGGYRGTSPVSIWGSIWYNFGPFGVLLCPVLIGYCYSLVYSRLIRGPKSLFRVLTYSGLSVLLGTWYVAGPTTVINNGVVTVYLLHVLIRTVERWRRVPPPAFYRRREGECADHPLTAY